MRNIYEQELDDFYRNRTPGWAVGLIILLSVYCTVSFFLLVMILILSIQTDSPVNTVTEQIKTEATSTPPIVETKTITQKSEPVKIVEKKPVQETKKPEAKPEVKQVPSVQPVATTTQPEKKCKTERVETSPARQQYYGMYNGMMQFMWVPATYKTIEKCE